MGSVREHYVGKGPFGYLDGLFDGTDPVPYDSAKIMLERSLPDAAAARFGDSDPRVSHFRDDWLGDGAYAWGDLQPEETLRAGLTRAITRAQGADPSHPKPMEFFWVTSGDEAFHVYYSDGPHQVTVIILTPAPVGPDDQPRAASARTPEPIWVVKKQDREASPTGQSSPGAVTELARVTSPTPATIIEQQVFAD